MSVHIDLSPFRYDGNKQLDLLDTATRIAPFYDGKKEYKDLMEAFQDEIDALQNRMYAHDRYSLLLIFQAMDAAGKDGTIRHIMSGVNVHGVAVHAFKRPSDTELDHDFLWRTTTKLPQRGRIGIFNRSYYEEVLVVKVHPEILTRYQKLPPHLTQDPQKVWQQRYRAIRDFEQYLHENGTHVIKFFLNLSRDEQRDRFISRIDRPEKNWKFSEGDVKERKHWPAYMKAYQEAINETARPHAPWYVVPADDKKNMRLIVSEAVLHHLRALNIHYPKIDDARREELQHYKEMLLKD